MLTSATDETPQQGLRRAESLEIVARSQSMREVLAFVGQIAASALPVLLQGESGSGKELIARALHEASPRRNGPFVAISMTVMADAMIESSLFGHEKGALGAETAREGLFRAAAGGTLLLDDIDEVPLNQQTKLLRAIEAREVLPLGADRPVPTDVRILAASTGDLATLVRKTSFRADLYFRLGGLRVDVPPLRNRPEDIIELASLFLTRHAREHGHHAMPGFDLAAEQHLLTYRWPGNVRELANVVERAALVCRNGTITGADLPPEVAGMDAAEGSGYQEAMEGFERSLLRSTLERANGERRAAARLLGISLATLYRRIEKLGLKDFPGAQGPRPVNVMTVNEELSAARKS